MGCFGLSHPNHPLLIMDLILVDQLVDSAYCEPHEDHLAFLTDYLSHTLEIHPHRWLSNWFHTHPRGMGPAPSGTDNTTFNSTRFSSANHSMMVILGGNDEFSCRLRTLSANPAFPPTLRELPVVYHLDLIPDHLPRAEWTALHTALTYPRPSPTATWHGTTPTYTRPSATDPIDTTELQEVTTLLKPNFRICTLNYNDAKYSISGQPQDSTPEGLIEVCALLPRYARFDCTQQQIKILARSLLDPVHYPDSLYATMSCISVDRVSIISEARRLIQNHPEGTPTWRVNAGAFLNAITTYSETPAATPPQPPPVAPWTDPSHLDDDAPLSLEELADLDDEALRFGRESTLFQDWTNSTPRATPLPRNTPQ